MRALSASVTRDDHRPEPRAHRHDGIAEARGHRGLGAHRSDARDHDSPGETLAQRVEEPFCFRHLAQALDLRPGREGHGVDPSVGDGLGEPQGGSGVVGQRPAVDRDRDDVGAELGEGVGQRPGTGPVELQRHPHPRQPPAAQLVEDLARHPGRRAPRHGQADGDRGAVGLGPPGVDPRSGQRVDERLGAAEYLGGLDHAPHPDPRAEDRHGGGPGDQVLDGRGQRAVDRHRVGVDRGAVEDSRTPPLEHGDLLVGTPVGGDPDHEPRQLLQRHRAIVASGCCPRVSGRLPASHLRLYWRAMRHAWHPPLADASDVDQTVTAFGQGRQP